MPELDDRIAGRATRGRRTERVVDERRRPVERLAVPVEARWLWHDGWEPVRRRAPNEPAEARRGGGRS